MGLYYKKDYFSPWEKELLLKKDKTIVQSPLE